jgi:hypothetical protein
VDGFLVDAILCRCADRVVYLVQYREQVRILPPRLAQLVALFGSTSLACFIRKQSREPVLDDLRILFRGAGWRSQKQPIGCLARYGWRVISLGRLGILFRGTGWKSEK